MDAQGKHSLPSPPTSIRKKSQKPTPLNHWPKLEKDLAFFQPVRQSVFSTMPLKLAHPITKIPKWIYLKQGMEKESIVSGLVHSYKDLQILYIF